MSAKPQLTPAIHTARLRCFADRAIVEIPRHVASAAGLFPGGFAAVQAIGPCIVICGVSGASSDATIAEAWLKTAAAIRIWEGQQ